MGDVIFLDGGLFPEPSRSVPPPDERTRGQRMRDRQQAAIDRGQHPLSVPLGAPLPLHPAAARSGVDVADVSAPTCGGCRFRQPIHGGNRSYPKCAAHPIPRSRTTPDGRTWRWEEHPRASHGEATDVRAWWPACIDYEPIAAVPG